MVIAIFGLPCSGKTTLSRKLMEYCDNNNIPVKIRKLSEYIEDEQHRKCSLYEINKLYNDRIQKNGNFYWATKILNDAQNSVVILDGVWYVNELKEIKDDCNSNYYGVFLIESRDVLYERCCETTIEKGEDIFEMKRVMDIIHYFDFGDYKPYVSISGNSNPELLQSIKEFINTHYSNPDL